MRARNILVAIFVLCAWTYSIFSYVFADTNLVLNSNPWYWNAQQWLWHNILPNNNLLVAIFASLIILFFGLYLAILYLAKKNNKLFSKRELILFMTLIFVPFLFAHNALSHDIFNYIFNAKVVLEYGDNPHTSPPGNYPDDLWLRFMHNTHGLSPYGYVWTGLSLLPYIFGFGKFILIFANFKIFSLLSLIFSIIFMYKILKLNKLINVFPRILLFAINPLVLIEFIGNAHNDLFMMVFALASYYYLILFTKTKMSKNTKYLFLSGLFLLISVGIKMSTVVLLPIFILAIILHYKHIKKIGVQEFVVNYFPILASIFMFVPLFFERSQQFYPWYLVWSMTWLPFIKDRRLILALISFSFWSMLRYLPWIYAGLHYGGEVGRSQKMITWLGGSVGFIILFLVLKLQEKKFHE